MESGSSSKSARKRKVAGGDAAASAKASAPPPSTVGGGKNQPPKPTQQMMLKWHDVWTRVTMSGLFDDVQRRSLTNEQLEEWVRFRLLLAGRIVLTCTRLKKAGLELPCAQVVEEDSQWLNKYAKDLGVNTSPKAAKLPQVAEIMEYLDRIAVFEADTTPAGIGVWAIVFSCWQGWTLTLERTKGCLDDSFQPIASFLAREDKFLPLIETASVLDDKVTGPKMKACEDVFCGALKHVSDFYEEMLFQGWSENSLPCKRCGRYGHTDAKCLFKAKASRVN